MEAANNRLRAQLVALDKDCGSSCSSSTQPATAAVAEMASKTDAVVSMVAGVAAAQARLLEGGDGNATPSPWLLSSFSFSAAQEGESDGGGSSDSMVDKDEQADSDSAETPASASASVVPPSSLAERGLELLTRVLGEAMGTSPETWPASLQVSHLVDGSTYMNEERGG